MPAEVADARAGQPVRRPSVPRLLPATVRLRLTLLYTMLFLACGAALLTIVYLLVDHATSDVSAYRYITSDGGVVGCNIAGPGSQVGHGSHANANPTVASKCTQLAIEQHTTLMHHLLAYSAIALAVMALLAIVLGWVTAGRVLRPLRTMTVATQRITEQNLHERLAMPGPDDELKRLGDTIDELLARLEGAFEAQRRFVANASHELRTPLTMIRTALDVATGKPTPAAGAVMLAGKIRPGLERAERLVDSFLTLARAERGGPLHTGPVSLDQLIATAMTEQLRTISALQLTVEQKLQDAPVDGSQALLSHLIDNLIGNAVRHNRPGGWICISTRRNTEATYLVVENSGDILDEHQVAELIEPFRRAGTDRTSGDQTSVGLGLSIVDAIVSAHHGALELRARPDGGLRVSVTLPTSEQSQPAGATA